MTNRNHLIDFHTHRPSGKHQEISSLHPQKESIPNSLFTLGIHPWWIEEITFEDFYIILKDNYARSHFYGLGEIGLDKAIQTSYQRQLEIFSKQLDLIKEFNIKRVILHCVKAYNDIVKELKKVSLKDITWIFHDYNGNEQITKDLLRFPNVYFSYGNKLFNQNSKGYKALKLIPVNRLFLETDDMNHSIEEVYNEASRILDFDYNELVEQIQKNFKSIS